MKSEVSFERRLSEESSCHQAWLVSFEKFLHSWGQIYESIKFLTVYLYRHILQKFSVSKARVIIKFQLLHYWR